MTRSDFGRALGLRSAGVYYALGVLIAALGCHFGAINPTAPQGEELTVIAAASLGGTSLFR